MKNDITDPRFAADGPSASYNFERNRMINVGESPEAAHQAGLKAHLAVFEKKDGIGAPGFETLNHFASIRRYEGEVKYQKALREMWARNPARAKAINLESPERLGQ